MTVRIQTGSVEPIEALLVDDTGVAVTGLSDVQLQIRRQSDSFFLDWADDTFKAAAQATTLQQPLAEVDVTYAPGRYHLASANHPLGWDSTKVANLVANDAYFITVDQATGREAQNAPQTGEITIGQWPDRLDLNVSGVAPVVRDLPLVGAPVGSLGHAVQLLRSISAKTNVRMDNFVYASGFMTSCRMRIFADSGAAAASTAGGVGEGEISTVTVAGTPDTQQTSLPSTVLGLLA